MSRASVQAAYEALLNVQYFALGPVGSAGITSEGEIALDRLLLEPNAPQLFKELLERGSPQAQAYALCGLRITDFAAYLRAVSAFREDEFPVDTMVGCMRGSLTMARVVEWMEAAISPAVNRDTPD